MLTDLLNFLIFLMPFQNINFFPNNLTIIKMMKVIMVFIIIIIKCNKILINFIQLYHFIKLNNFLLYSGVNNDKGFPIG